MAVEDRRRQQGNRLGAAGWGLFFLWVGTCWLLAVNAGVTLLGIAAITFLVQAIRAAIRLDVEWLWIAVGACFAIGGVGDLAEKDVQVMPIVLVLAGVLLFFGAAFGWRRERHE